MINCGGIAEKSAFVMQIYADVLNRPMLISRSGQTCALGAAIFGSIVGGVYPTAADAQAHMTGIKDVTYTPNPDAVAVYAQLFEMYSTLHDAFGGVTASADLGPIMPRLLDLREQARQGG